MSFEQFWSEFPPLRRDQKQIARAKWDAITSEAGLHTRMLDKSSGTMIPAHIKSTPAEIMRGLRYYKAHKEPEFVHSPVVWLNKGLWLDYSEEQMADWERKWREAEAFRARRESERAERDQAAVIRMQARRA